MYFDLGTSLAVAPTDIKTNASCKHNMVMTVHRSANHTVHLWYWQFSGTAAISYATRSDSWKDVSGICSGFVMVTKAFGQLFGFAYWASWSPAAAAITLSHFPSKGGWQHGLPIFPHSKTR